MPCICKSWAPIIWGKMHETIIRITHWWIRKQQHMVEWRQNKALCIESWSTVDWITSLWIRDCFEERYRENCWRQRKFNAISGSVPISCGKGWSFHVHDGEHNPEKIIFWPRKHISLETRGIYGWHVWHFSRMFRFAWMSFFIIIGDGMMNWRRFHSDINNHNEPKKNLKIDFQIMIIEWKHYLHCDVNRSLRIVRFFIVSQCRKSINTARSFFHRKEIRFREMCDNKVEWTGSNKCTTAACKRSRLTRGGRKTLLRKKFSAWFMIQSWHECVCETETRKAWMIRFWLTTDVGLSNKFAIATEAIHRAEQLSMTVDLSRWSACWNIDSWVGSAIWASDFPNRLSAAWLEGIVTGDERFD